MAYSSYTTNTSINDNDNARVIYNSPNDNDIESSRSVDLVADKLVDKFGSPSSREFYCKIAQHLTEFEIDKLVTKAFKNGREPGALFNHLARKELAR